MTQLDLFKLHLLPYPRFVPVLEDAWVSSVGAVMSPSVITLYPVEPAIRAMALMVDYRIRTIPVVNDAAGGKVVVGVVTRRDLMAALKAENGGEVKPTRRDIGGVAHLDALLPPEMAAAPRRSASGRSAMDATTAFTLAVLAGAFIALGGVFATTALAGAGAAPWGAIRVLAGVAFSVGLVLVMVGGAELFTGNNLIVMAWASRRVSTWALLRNWLIVFAGNFAGPAALRSSFICGGHSSARRRRRSG